MQQKLTHKQLDERRQFVSRLYLRGCSSDYIIDKVICELNLESYSMSTYYNDLRHQGFNGRKGAWSAHRPCKEELDAIVWNDGFPDTLPKDGGPEVWECARRRGDIIRGMKNGASQHEAEEALGG